MPSVKFVSITDVTTKYFNNYITNSLKKHEGLRAICSPRHVSLTNAAFCYKTFFFPLVCSHPIPWQKWYSIHKLQARVCGLTAAWEELGQRQTFIYVLCYQGERKQ